MSVIKLAVWRATDVMPVDDKGYYIEEKKAYKYVVVGTIVSERPIENLHELPSTQIVEGNAAEIEDWLRSVTPRRAKHEGRTANDYLRELNEQ